ncbi:hypothetical protein BER30_002560 [Clostridioides difficile]|nr:hypothetical protein [Clostridioides difficile]OMK30773.1 hypothetical protein BER30_002560 [Clostridioides difficile]
MSTLRDHSNNIRKNIIKMVAEAKSGHPGGSLSIADMLTVLYFDKMNVCAENPKMADRDRFVLSKGHAAPALYATLAEKGFFPEEELITLRKFGSKLQGHPDMKKSSRNRYVYWFSWSRAICSKWYGTCRKIR